MSGAQLTGRTRTARPARRCATFSAPCKIGITQHLASRLRQVQISCPFTIGIAWSFTFLDRTTAEAVEHAFHSQQRSKRLHGEWFDVGHLEAMRLLCAISRRAIPRDRNFNNYLQFSSVDWAERRFGFWPAIREGATR